VDEEAPKTPRRVAEQLGLTSSTLGNWAKKDTIPFNTLVTDEMTSLVSGCPDESTTCHSPSRKRKSPSSPPCKTSSQIRQCLATSVTDSSASARGSRGFWNRSKEDWSKCCPPGSTRPILAPSSLNGVSSESFSSFSIQRHSHPPQKSLQTSKRIVHVFSCRVHNNRRCTGPPSSGTKRNIGGLQRTGCGSEEATQASVRSRPGSRGAADALCGDEAPARAVPSTPSLVQGRPMDLRKRRSV